MSGDGSVTDLTRQLVVEWRRWRRGEAGRWARIEALMRQLDRKLGIGEDPPRWFDDHE